MTNDDQVLVFFPGGMASQLRRSDGRLVWIANDFDLLQIGADGSDYQGVVIEPDGVTPHLYDRFLERFRPLVFAWDWRRSVREAAERFLATVEPQLPPYTLIGHSAGGMVVKIIANQSPAKMRRAITVGTPFFGCGTQIRLFMSPVAQIVASLPGAYEYLFMDRPTFQQNRRALSDDKYFLLDYPAVDWLPETMNLRLLEQARMTATLVAQPLPPSVADRFHCVRGVQAKIGVIKDNTVIRHWKRWGQLVDLLGPGDGVEAAWSARLPGSHVIDIVDDLSHETMMNEAFVQEVLAELIRYGGDDAIRQ